jgi:hypothetical protein
VKYTWDQTDVIAGQRFKLPMVNNEGIICADLANDACFIVYTADGNYNWSGQSFGRKFWANWLTNQNAQPIGWGIGSSLQPEPPSPPTT